MANPTDMGNALATEGNDAVCFTAGFSGALFAAGTIHAHLAARRPTPRVAAGISMGAVSAAAMQRCYQELDRAKAGEEDSARWSWFRRYLSGLYDCPLNVFWDAIPDQSDFFADFPPILDSSTPESLKPAEREARRRRYLLVKLGQWLAGLPVKFSTVVSSMVTWVRYKEKYPGWRGIRLLMFGFWAIRLVGGISRHVTFAPQFFRYRYEREESKFPWWGRPLFGWKIWLLSFFPVLIVAAALVVLVTPLVVLLIGSRATISDLAAQLDAIERFTLPPGITSLLLTILVSLVVFIVELFAFVWVALLVTESPAGLLRAFLGNIGLTESLIDDFHLRKKLTELFDPETKGVAITHHPMEIVLVCTWLNTLHDANGKPRRPDQRWAANGSPLVESLRTALTRVPFFAPTRLGKDDDEKIRQWVGRDLLDNKVQMPSGLDLVDGGSVRENPLPALFMFLRLREKIAAALSSNGKDPSIHVVYSVPLPDDQGPGRMKDEDTDIVNVALASMKLAKRRDTQLEVMQTNFMSLLKSEIVDQEQVVKAKAQVATATTMPVTGPEASKEMKDAKLFPIFVDQIAPRQDLSFKNPINPTRNEVLQVVADGCRQTLQTLYHNALAATGRPGEKVPCATFLVELDGLRGSKGARSKICGLPEVCEHCTRELIRPATVNRVRWLSEASAESEIKSLETPGHKTLLERFPNLSGKTPRIVFVASGGVFRGAFHIGMIAAMVQTRVRPDMIVGASVGTLMGGALGALFSVPDGHQKWELLGNLAEVFLHVDDRVAFTKRLKSASRELGVRGRSVNLSPARIRRAVRKGGKSDPGFAVSGAPPSVVDAISDVFMIPHRKTALIAAELIAGHVTKAADFFLSQLRRESLKRLDIQYAVMDASLLEQVAGELLGKPIVNLDCAQPYNNIAFFATTTNLGSKMPYLLGREPSDPRVPYNFVEEGLSSSAFPCVFAPRRESDLMPGRGFTDVRYSDGGMFDNLPFLPSIDMLASVQREFRVKSAVSPVDFLKNRYQRPDLFLAGSLDVNPEDDLSDDGKKPNPYDTIVKIRKRTQLLANNTKIRGFEWAAEMVHAQVEQLLALIAQRPSLSKTSEDFLDKIVDSAVLPVFPSSPDHLNGTFEFCASLGMDPGRIQRSIADGCFQTLKAFADASKGASFVSQVVRIFQEQTDDKGDPRIPAVAARHAKDSSDKGQCPYFLIGIKEFVCPFARAAEAQSQEAKQREVREIYTVCVRDKVHKSKVIQPAE